MSQRSLASCLVLAVLAGCGTSAAQVRTARDTYYDAPYAIIWNACSEEVRKRYVGIHMENAVQGRIETDYRAVESTSQDVTGGSGVRSGAVSGGGGVNQQSQFARNVSNEAAIFRMTVQIVGPPWRISVDGLAAKYEPDKVLPIPYSHGAIDEPPWVQTRIDSLTVAIHERLKKYAIAIDKPKLAARQTDVSAWANLDDRGAVQVIGEVRKAAGDRNTKALRPLMIDAFEWSEGAAASAEMAVAVWSADPSALRLLARTLDAGCAPDVSSTDVVCPKADSPETGKARFRQIGSSWKLVEFLH